eukprot:tig00000113_g5633.t1
MDALSYITLCDHPNVLRCEALFTDRFKLYIVMPLAETSLSALLVDRGVLPADLVASFAFQIASGMSYLHHELPRPVAHRDLKPQNILVFRGDDGSGPTLRVGDFGISRRIETAQSSPGIRGTLVYLPPETYTKNDPVKADVWAFGIILMEMATGWKPYGGDAATVGPEHVVKGQPFPRAAFGVVPEQLRPLARSCLSRSLQQRPTFLTIRQTLAGILQLAPSGSTSASAAASRPATPVPVEPDAEAAGLAIADRDDREAISAAVRVSALDANKNSWLPSGYR